MTRLGLLLLLLLLTPIAAAAQTDPVSAAVERKDWPEAIRLLRTDLDADPGNPEIRFRMGQVTAWSGDFSGSILILRRLIEDVPTYGEAIILLARVHAWKGDFAQSEALYGSVARTDPSFPDALAGLAQLAYYRGDLNTAYVATSHILRSYPGNETALLVRDAIRRGMRTESEFRVLTPWDSDGNSTWILSEQVEFSLRPGVRSLVRFRAVDNGSAVFGGSGGIRWNRYSASLGLNAYRQAARFDIDASVSARFANTTVFGNRYGLFDTPTLIARSVSVTELGAAHLYRRGTITLATTSTLASYSTGNQRAALSVDLIRALPFGDFTVSPGATLAASGFLKNDPTGGFFAPKWWSVNTANLTTVYSPAASAFQLSLSTHAGVQSIAPYDAERIGPDFSYALDARASYVPSQDLQIDAGYMVSTLVGSTTQASDSYRAQRLGLRLFIRF